MKRDGLEAVRKAAAKDAAARGALHVEIRKARDAGQSLRAVAQAAGVSYETVRKIAEP